MSDMLHVTRKGFTGSWDNAMNVRVQTKILPPEPVPLRRDMKHTHGTGFNAEMGIAELA